MNLEPKVGILGTNRAREDNNKEGDSVQVEGGRPWVALATSVSPAPKNESYRWLQVRS